MPCGRDANTATSRMAGPIQQMPGNMRIPTTASNAGTIATRARPKRFILTSVAAIPNESVGQRWRLNLMVLKDSKLDSLSGDIVPHGSMVKQLGLAASSL